MTNYRDEILELWNNVRNSADFIEWLLKESDFFVAPCSTIFHLACPGGLAEHSYNVYSLLSKKVKDFKLDAKISEESIIICGLGHDLCKTNFYKIVDDEVATDAQLKYLRTLATEQNYDKYLENNISKDLASSLIRWYKDGKVGKEPQKEVKYVVDDKFPMGHGEKSVSILQDFFSLTDEEKLSIRWHMCGFDPGTHFNYPSGYPFNKAISNYPLVSLLFTADYESTYVLEGK